MDRSLPSTPYQEQEEAAGGASSRPSHIPQSDSYLSSEGHSQEYEQHQDTVSDLPAPVNFDEAVLRNLCDIDCGLPLLLDRLKQCSSSTKEASNFLRKRAQIEEEYARSSIRLARSSIDSYRESDGKAGTFVTSYSAFLRTHELIGENHLKFASQLNETADQLLELTREVERQRKNGKEVGSRLDRVLNEAEGSMEKAKNRFDGSVEELERCLLSKAGEPSSGRAEFQQTNPNLSSHGYSSSSSSMSLSAQSNATQPPPSKRTFGKAMSKLKSGGKSGFSNKTEEDLRLKMATASDAYRKEVQYCQGVRREHWVVGIPRILRTLKESSDEIDFGTQFHLSRYTHLFEQMTLQDGMTVSPPGGIEEGPGLKKVVEALDSREDFTKYMEHYALAWAQSPAGQKGPAKRGDGMLDEDGYALASAPVKPPPRSGSVSSISHHNGAPSISSSDQHRTTPLPPPATGTFGVSLTEQMERTGVEVPKILESCAAVVEQYGIDSQGIYRLSGTTSRIQKLKARLDADVDAVDLTSPENLQDINDISGVLKLWFRELPEPLMTYEGYHGFIEAAKIENPRFLHIRTHERVNDLPDAHYACLKALMGHLHNIQKHGSVNSMNMSNLAIVFGPTLFRPPPGEEANALADMSWQCKSIETILTHYEAIFVPSEEDEAEQHHQQQDQQSEA